MRPILAALAAALAACGDGPSLPDPVSGKPAGATCASAAECRPDLVCFENACVDSLPPAPSCAPPGAPRLVLGDPVVLPEPPPGACLAPVREPVLADGTVQDLGELRVGSRVGFRVPEGTTSFSITSQAVEGSAVPEIAVSGIPIPNSVVPTDVLLPDGTLFFDDLAPYPLVNGYEDVTGLLAFYGGATPGSGTFTAPNTSSALDLVRTAGEVPPGIWSLTVNDWARECLEFAECTGGSDDARYRLHAVTRPGRVAATGTLDVEVYLATDPAGVLPDAATALADPQTERFVRSLSGLFANAGICLGTVTFRDLPEWARARYAPNGVVDVSGGAQGVPADEVAFGCDDLSQLFTVAVAPSPAVHLFLSEELVDVAGPELGTTLGVDGSIPGPSGFPGTVNGGAIVGIFGSFGAETRTGACADAPSFACGTDLLAYVAAHEAGHWLGLYHTTEWDGTRFDPLRDTPVCPCAVCVPDAQRPACAELGGTTAVPASSCTRDDAPVCGGAGNLMFWLLDPRHAAGALSPEQGQVMRLNPAVR